MPSKIDSYRIFIASPGGLSDERQAFRDEVEEINILAAKRDNIQFEAVGWEDTIGAVGRPQGIINEDLRGCDFFILMLCDRWGMHPGGNSGYTSGTEEEYYEAMQCYEKGTMRQMLLMFKSIDIKQLNDPGEQLTKVLNFKKSIEEKRQHLYKTFDSVERFKSILRTHLHAWLSDIRKEKENELPKNSDELRGHKGHENNPENSANPISKKPILMNEAVINSENELRSAWKLVNEGKLTQAEIAFARIIINTQDAAPLTDYSLFLIRTGLYDRAEGMLQEAIKIASKQQKEQASLQNYQNLSSAFSKLGIIERYRGNTKEAISKHWQALEYARLAGNPYMVGGVYVNLGDLEMSQGQFDNALSMYDKALAEHTEFDIKEAIATDYLAIGQIYFFKRELDKAVKFAEQAQSIYLLAKGQDIEDDFVANVLNLKGKIYQRLGRFEIAEGMFYNALRINEKTGRVADVASMYGSLGHLYEIQGLLDKAENMQRTALELEEKIGYLPGIAESYEGLGSILNKKKSFDESELMLRKAIELFERINSPSRVLECQKILDKVLIDKGKPLSD